MGVFVGKTKRNLKEKILMKIIKEMVRWLKKRIKLFGE